MQINENRGISDKEIIAISEIIKAYGCKKLVDIKLVFFAFKNY